MACTLVSYLTQFNFICDGHFGPKISTVRSGFEPFWSVRSRYRKIKIFHDPGPVHIVFFFNLQDQTGPNRISTVSVGSLGPP